MQTEISAPQKKHQDHGWTITFIILAITIVAAVFYAGGIIPQVKKTYFLKDVEGVLVPKENFASGSALLIDTLTFTTVTPRPTTYIPPGVVPISPQVSPTCTEAVAVDFLVDTSGSMQGDKLNQLRSALSGFGAKLSDSSIVGMQAFGGTAEERVPIGLYSQVRSQFVNASQNIGLIPGGTYTRSGFSLARSKLTEAKQRFPDRDFKLIFLSDGIPETAEFNGACQSQYFQTGDLSGLCAQNCRIDFNSVQVLKCFASAQDPSVDPSLVDAVKNMGVEIYSVAILDANDTRFNTQLEELMKNAASSPNNYYKTFNPEDLDNIYNQIATQVCN